MIGKFWCSIGKGKGDGRQADGPYSDYVRDLGHGAMETPYFVREPRAWGSSSYLTLGISTSVARSIHRQPFLITATMEIKMAEKHSQQELGVEEPGRTQLLGVANGIVGQAHLFQGMSIQRQCARVADLCLKRTAAVT
jgi:hypothetical protein